MAESPGWGTGTVDLAVSDPEQPGRHILGIECDGPSYDRAGSARDRDRLRPQVLEGLGWKLHRAWSPEWASNPQKELERVLAAIDAPHAQSLEELIQEQVEPDSPEEQCLDNPGAIIRDAVPAPAGYQVTEYQEAKLSSRPADRNLAAASARSLERWTVKVVQVESPVHISEVARRVCTESGVKRPGKRVQDALDEAVSEIVRSGRVFRRGDFLWSTDMTRPPVRDRSGLPATSRKLEMVSDEEMAEAICVVVGRSYGIVRDQTPARAAKLLGFSRTTQAIKDRSDSVTNGLLSEGRLEADGDLLVIGESPGS